MSVPIVGVVGGNGLPQSVLDLARSIAARLVEDRCILLTGGEAAGDQRTVKSTAMWEFVKAAKPGVPVGAVGVLPGVKRRTAQGPAGARPAEMPGVHAGAVETSSTDERWITLTSPPDKPSARLLYVHTGVTSHQRNLLTGGLPDVVIALPGGAGTLSEVAYALSLGTPVVLAGSWSALREESVREPDGVRKIVAELGDPSYDAQDVARGLADFFTRKPDPSRVFDRESVSDAVSEALKLGRKARRSLRYPEMSLGNPLLDFKESFEAGIADLERHVLGPDAARAGQNAPRTAIP